jgi:Zn-dependent peptidase ImmA (M78 family)
MCRWDAKAVFNFFPKIKQTINDLLDDGDGYSQNPEINIELIARNIGIKDIQYVSPEKISAKYPKAHAYIDEENSIIYVSNNYNYEKQRFLIAHEIFHFLFVLLNKDGCALSISTRRGDLWKKENAGSDEAVGEDIADFFAANLLVPTERFILWDDKTDNEIAIAFKVEEKCIKKRRKEIEYELYMLEPKIHLDEDTGA